MITGMSVKRWVGGILCLVLVLAPLLTAGSVRAGGILTIYSGRSENLIGPVFERFLEETGIEIRARYGDTAEMAATILEEGQNSPADLFFAQDAGALGALARAGRLVEIPGEYLDAVDPRLRTQDGLWVGTSGRARVIAYNTDRVKAEELPDSIWGFTEQAWEGRIGWAPTNGSFQAFVTAVRILEGDQRTEDWLRAIMANSPRNYHNNTAIVDALGRGEIDIGFTNHYYLFRFLSEHGEEFPVRNHYTTQDAGAMINIAGIGVLDVARNEAAAHRFVEYILSEDMQMFFVEANNEYPAVTGLESGNPHMPPLEEIDAPTMDLSNLDDLQGTLQLLFQVGAL